MFQRLLNQWAAAIVANDAEQIREFTTADWQLLDPAAGPIPLERFLAVVRSGELIHTHMYLHARSVLNVREDVAVVIVHGSNEGSWRGNPFSAREWTTDVFVQDGGQWRCRHTSITPDAAH